MEKTNVKKTTNKNKPKNLNPQKIFDLITAFVLRGGQFESDFCKQNNITHQAVSYQLRKLRTSFGEVRKHLIDDPNTTLQTITLLQNTPVPTKSSKLKVNYDESSIFRSTYDELKNEPKDLNTQGGSRQRSEEGDRQFEKSDKCNLRKTNDLSFLGKKESSDGEKLDHKLLLDMAPPHLKSVLRDLLEAYEDADAKTKGTLFGQILKYMKEMNQMQGLGEVELWRTMSYKRPSNLAPKQVEIIEAMKSHLITFVKGSRRTRKTTTFWRFDFEYALELAFEGKTTTKTLFVAATDENAETIHLDIRKADFSNDIHEYIVKDMNRVSVFNFGHEFMVRAPSDRQVKGLDANVVCFDETDNLFISHGKVIADAVATALTNDLKIIFLSNNPKVEEMGAFNVFVDMFRSLNYWKDKCDGDEVKAKSILDKIAYIEVCPEDFPEMQTEEFNEKNTLVKTLQTELVSQEYADSQLSNVESVSGVTFPADLLIESERGYSNFVNNILRNRALSDIVLGIDPSGGGHPTGLSVWGYFEDMINNKYYIYEIYSEKIEGAKNLDTEYIFNRILTLIQCHHVHLSVVESNSGGLQLVDRLRRNGYFAENLNIRDGDRTSYGHTDFINVFKNYLFDKCLYIQSKELKVQLSRYSPHTSKDTKKKGDLADAALLAVFKINKKHSLAEENLRSYRRSLPTESSTNNVEIPRSQFNMRPRKYFTSI